MKAAIYNYTAWIEECEPTRIAQAMDVLLDEAGFHVLQFTDHHFEPQGYTAIWLLSESHLAVHTFPEEGKTYIELSSCNFEKNSTFEKELSRAEFKLTTASE